LEHARTEVNGMTTVDELVGLYQEDQTQTHRYTSDIQIDESSTVIASWG